MELVPYSETGGLIAAIVFLAAAVWKIWLRVRQEVRADGAEKTTLDGYSAIIEQLRTEVRRLSVAVNELGTALEEERRKRRAAEARVSVLEGELEQLKNGNYRS